MRKFSIDTEKMFQAFFILPGIYLSWNRNKWKTLNIKISFEWFFWRLSIKFAE